MLFAGFVRKTRHRSALSIGRILHAAAVAAEDCKAFQPCGRHRSPAKGLHLRVRVPPKLFVYVLRSLSDPERPYIGLTHDVQARLEAHNAGRCAHTARYRPWELRAWIGFTDEHTAIRFERYLKSGSGCAFAKRQFE